MSHVQSIEDTIDHKNVSLRNDRVKPRNSEKKEEEMLHEKENGMVSFFYIEQLAVRF